MRRQTAREPAFGSDSFLDVTANLVGVLIILIVLVGLRTTKAPARAVTADAELDRRIDQVRGDVEKLRLQRDELSEKLADLRHTQSATATAVETLETHDQRVADSAHELREQVAERQDRADEQSRELAAARARLVSLGHELDQLRAGPAAPRQLVYRSPLSRPVEAGEIHFEVRAGRATFIDLNGLIEQARTKRKTLEAELRETGRATAEVGPVGAFRLGIAVVREALPLRESVLYGNVRFWTSDDWKLLPVLDPRGEGPDQALAAGSQFESVLARYSPNKYAVTLWTYPDSFAAFRRLRDHLHARGYSVAARPMPTGVKIGLSPNGAQSFVQ